MGSGVGGRGSEVASDSQERLSATGAVLEVNSPRLPLLHDAVLERVIAP